MTFNLPDLVAGFLIGAIFGVVFEDPLKQRWAKFVDSVRARINHWRFGDIKSGGFFWCFGRQTNLYIIDGSGSLKYSTSGIRVNLGNPPDFPKSIEERRLRELEEIKNGSASWWNGNLLGIKSYSVQRNGEETELELNLDVYKHDYATFRATTCALVRGESYPGELSIEYGIINQTPIGKPAVPLASGLGVFSIIVSSDGKIFSASRASSSGVRPGQRDYGVCEAVHPTLDNIGSGSIDLFSTAVRSVREEVGGDDVSIRDVSIVGFVVDVPWQQFVLIACVQLNDSALDVMGKRSLGASGKWEVDTMRFDLPKAAFRMMRFEETWDLGVLANFMVACQLWGRENAKKFIGAS